MANHNEAFNSVDSGSHPVVRGQYAILTAPMLKTFDIVAEWIRNRASGGYLYGYSRYGKSWFIRFWLSVLIDEAFGSSIPVFLLQFRIHNRFSETLFLEELLGSSGHGLVRYRNKREIFERLTRHYATAARNCGGNQVVLVIDEAQDLQAVHYRHLVSIENELNNLGFLLTVICIGTQEIGYLHNLTISSGSTHISGRYLVRHSRFRGIATINELKKVLENYDVQTEWPEESRTSFTKYFLPEAFDEGFRIQSCADTMWECYEKLGLSKDKHDVEVPMEHVAKAVENMYRFNSDRDVLTLGRIRDEGILEAIQSTQYAAHMQAIGATQ
jgi:hypothetical protein